MQYVDLVFEYAPIVISLAAILTAGTPVPTSGALLKARQILDLMAFNFGNAKNQQRGK